ncbi:MAG: beta-N-acetylhexosaminidase [Armatimonadetes bacterium]|nr:beta-N-acetylhexosaminidase [Armatimonadota bacterium]
MKPSTLTLPELSQLTIEQKAAQMVMIDIPGTKMAAHVREHLSQTPWNGVILFAKNTQNRAQVVELVEEIHAASPIQPLISVDQEGGLVDRFRFPEMTLSPGCMALAATGDPGCTREAHRIMGIELRSLGMHLDFAPCVDVNVNPQNPIIGVRSFGEDPVRVAKHGAAAVEGLRAGGVGATAKHFPGHGDTDRDSHIALPTVSHSRERLEAVELLPFRAAIERQVEAIMTAHVTFPAIDPREGIPATLSRAALEGLLRGEMGYEGVIVTDSMAMKAVADRFGVAEAAVMSVEAGADLVLACGPIENQLETVRGLVEAVKSGRLSQERLDQSLRRLFELKRRYAARPEQTLTYDRKAHESSMRRTVERSVTLVRNQGILPLTGRVLVLMPDMLPLTPLGEMDRGESLRPYLEGADLELSEERYHFSTESPPIGPLAEKAAAAGTVVLAVYGRDRLPDAQRDLAEAVLRANPRTVLVSLSSPYLLLDLPHVPAYVLSYNYTPYSLEMLGRVLTGRLKPTGRLPVGIPGHYPAGHGLAD